MIHVLHSLIDAVFPPRETEKLLRNIDALPYQAGIHEGVYYLSEYGVASIQAAITENKFHHNRKASRLLSQLCTSWEHNQTGAVVWVPIPLGQHRQKVRGHNQVRTVLEFLPEKTIIYALRRTIETPPQIGLEKTARLKNIQGAFSFTNTILSPNTTYVLIDDVVTTGATLNAARAELAPHIPDSSKLICLALAH